MVEEAKVLNWFWDFAVGSILTKGHPYYRCIGQDIKALVRGYNES